MALIPFSKDAMARWIFSLFEQGTNTTLNKNYETDKLTINSSSTPDLSGYAPIVDGKIPIAYIPGQSKEVERFANLEAFPDPGSVDVIYIANDSLLDYAWDGTGYVPLGAGVSLGETAASAHRGDHGKAAYDHSQVMNGNPHGTTLDQISEGTTYVRVTLGEKTTWNNKVGDDDERLTDERDPTDHTHAQSEISGLVAALAQMVTDTGNRALNILTGLSFTDGSAIADGNSVKVAIGKLYRMIGIKTSQTLTPSGGAVTMNANTSVYGELNMNAATVNLTLSNTINGDTLVIRATQDATGGRALSLVAIGGVTIEYTNGGDKTLSTAAGKVDLITFIRFNNRITVNISKDILA